MITARTFALTLAAAATATAFAVAASDSTHSIQGARDKPAQPQAPQVSHDSHEKSGKPQESHSVHWSYAGEGGPGEWGRLEPDFAKCYLGKAQSPVNIAGSAAKKLAAIAFNYQPSKFDVVNNGHTVQFNYESGSYMELDGKRYELLQFHFHAPSEHALDGNRYPLEFHFVHKNGEGKLAVIGVMASAGKANAAYRVLLDNLPLANGEERRNKNIVVNAADLLPKNRSYAAYSGSLTTPPCSEEVAWRVLTRPVSLSESQIAGLKQTYAANSRPLQKLNGRELVVSGN